MKAESWRVGKTGEAALRLFVLCQICCVHNLRDELKELDSEKCKGKQRCFSGYSSGAQFVITTIDIDKKKN